MQSNSYDQSLIDLTIISEELTQASIGESAKPGTEPETIGGKPRKKVTWGENIFYEHGDTALYLASRNGDLDKVQSLLERGAIALHQSHRRNRETPLFAAVRHGHLNIVKALLEAGANPDTTDYKHRVPLNFAIMAGRLDIVKALLEARANPNTKDYKGRSPLILAVDKGDCELVSILIAKGAKVDNGFTLLYLAIKDNTKLGILKILLNAGADRAITDDVALNTLLASIPTIEVAKLFFSNANLDLIYPSKFLTFLAEKKFANPQEVKELIELFISRKLDPRQQNKLAAKEFAILVDFAFKYNFEEICHQLIRQSNLFFSTYNRIGIQKLLDHTKLNENTNLGDFLSKAWGNYCVYYTTRSVIAKQIRKLKAIPNPESRTIAKIKRFEALQEKLSQLKTWEKFNVEETLSELASACYYQRNPRKDTAAIVLSFGLFGLYNRYKYRTFFHQAQSWHEFKKLKLPGLEAEHQKIIHQVERDGVKPAAPRMGR